MRGRSPRSISGGAFYAKVWDQERKDLPLIYIWTGKNIVGMKKALMGFQQVPDGLIRLQGTKIGQ